MDFGILPNHPPPPPKGECLQCASVTLLRPTGRWRGDAEGGRGRNEDEVHGAMQFCCWFWEEVPIPL